MSKQVILASQSPRRQELMKFITSNFIVEAPHVDEKKIEDCLLKRCKPSRKTAKKLVAELSFEKAMAVYKNHPDHLVIGADTVVVLGNEVLGKPGNKKEAVLMLKKLFGKTHLVMTGVTIIDEGSYEQFVSSSSIRFYNWTNMMKQAVIAYVESGKPMDKAGAYGIQEEAGLFVKWIKGDYNNIVGLPVGQLNRRIYKRINEGYPKYLKK
ncbi:Maf family protein [Eubacteriaceae bacterium ES2]|nr:Maf family protein [Eubacteriaceae bacterium ES2]